MSIKLYSSSLLYIIPLVIVIIFGILLSNSYEFSGSDSTSITQPPGGNNGPAEPTAFPQTATISFIPAAIPLSGNGSTEITLDPGGAEVTAIQVEITYDESKISIDSFTPGSYFQNPTIDTNQISSGKITYNVAASLTGSLPSSAGMLATINFSKKSGATESTTLTFTGDTAVTAKGSSGQSILKDRGIATINL